jgi:endonuclease-3 related protein
MMSKILSLYNSLYEMYGPQGWWPLLELHGKKGCNPTKSGSIKGYHPDDYSYPKNKRQQFEICIGAILAQNTSWPNVEKALINLKDKRLLDAEKIISASDKMLSDAIRPAGYFNQKTKKLKIFSKFYKSLKGKTPSRGDLLNCWGVGPETADSILLYVYKQPEFVVDTYTKRILREMKIITSRHSYDDIKSLFEDDLSKDYKLFQEFHALIVEHAKRLKR